MFDFGKIILYQVVRHLNINPIVRHINFLIVISDMNVSSNLGISPVLLQAISTLTSGEGRSERVSVKQERVQPPVPSTSSMERAEDKVVSHLLQGNFVLFSYID